MIIYALAQKFEIVKKLKGKINEKTFINWWKQHNE
jgi:hypothetical protein